MLNRCQSCGAPLDAETSAKASCTYCGAFRGETVPSPRASAAPPYWHPTPTQTLWDRVDSGPNPPRRPFSSAALPPRQALPVLIVSFLVWGAIAWLRITGSSSPTAKPNATARPRAAEATDADSQSALPRARDPLATPPRLDELDVPAVMVESSGSVAASERAVPATSGLGVPKPPQALDGQLALEIGRALASTDFAPCLESEVTRPDRSYFELRHRWKVQFEGAKILTIDIQGDAKYPASEMLNRTGMRALPVEVEMELHRVLECVRPKAARAVLPDNDARGTVVATFDDRRLEAVSTE